VSQARKPGPNAVPNDARGIHFIAISTTFGGSLAPKAHTRSFLRTSEGFEERPFPIPASAESTDRPRRRRCSMISAQRYTIV
jgi:hypothetical protein